MSDQSDSQLIHVELSAVIISVRDAVPEVMILKGNERRDAMLPTGPLGTTHRKLQQSLRIWVEAQIGLQLGYIEQLYTFADITRLAAGRRLISIGYLALTRDPALAKSAEPHAIYDYLPWEDHRAGVPAIVMALRKELRAWQKTAPDAAMRAARASRIAVTFPDDLKLWNDELVLQRYELLWEAGLVVEKVREQAGFGIRDSASGQQTESLNPKSQILSSGSPLAYDHRRMLATGLARLRAKIKYRPVVFELLPERFTLLQLQSTVEALAGLRLHKQNFRRLVLSQGLVEETTAQTTTQRGRPAQLYKFRAEVLQERAAAGTKLPRHGAR